MSRVVRLSSGRGVLQVERELLDLAGARVAWQPFADAAASSAPLVLSVELAASLPDGSPLHGPLGTCRLVRDGARLRVELGTGPFVAELALRIAVLLATYEQGGILLHAAALADDRRAAVAAGASGAGKSTLARLGRGAGLTLLSDEIVQVFPDGAVAGSPFASDLDNRGSPGAFPAGAFLALVHGPAEGVDALPAVEAAALALAQRFEVPGLALPSAEANRRTLSFLGRVERRRFTFRQHPEAGQALRTVLA